MRTKKKSKESPKGRLYLVSPITGVPNGNASRLNNLEKAWSERGWDVINPALFTEQVDTPDELTLHRHSIAKLATCDAVAVLPEITDYSCSFGWKEIEIAKSVLNIPVWNADWPGDEITFETDLATEARNTVYGPREHTYGHPSNFFVEVSQLWGAHLCMDIRTKDVIVMMILFKLARLENAPLHRDTYVDIIGYALAGARAMGIEK